MNFIYTKRGFAKKPETDEEKAYCQRKKNYIWADLSIPEIAEKFNEGHTWRAGYYDKHNGTTFKKNEVLGAYIIALDFDNCPHEPQELVDYAISIGVIPNIWYYSFGQGIKPQYNFRLVWFLEQGITCKAYEEIYKSFLATFADFGPDGSTKDCSRMWYGGKNAQVICEDPINMADCGWLTILDKARQGKEIRQAIKGQKGGLPDYNALPYPDSVNVLASKPWWECLRGRCYLWDKWQNGEYLNYNQRAALFSNLKFLKYTSQEHSVYDDIMKFYNAAAYEGHTCNEAQIKRLLNERQMRPYPIVKQQKYQKNTQTAYWTYSNISPVGKNNKNTEKINKSDFISVPEFIRQHYNDCPLIGLHDNEPNATVLDEWFDDNFQKFINAGGISYLKVQTGAGKTEAMIKYIANEDLTNKKIIYALQNFIQIREFGGRFKEIEQKNEIHLLPERDKTETDDIYYKLGLTPPPNVERSAFMRAMNAATGGLWVITHALLARLRNIDADLIVIDENIEEALFRTVRMTDTELSSVATFLGGQEGRNIKQFISQLRTLKQGEIISLDLLKSTLPAFGLRIDEFIATHNKTSMPEGYFDCKDNDYGKRGHIGNEVCVRITEKTPFIIEAKNKGVPVKIMTATPTPARVENGYGIELEMFKAPHCRNAGKISQYTAKSGARGANNEKLVDLIKYAKSKITNDTLIITFKGGEAYMSDGDAFMLARVDGEQIHFYNCAGLDIFKGKKIAIVGKFDRPRSYYEELWEDIGDGSELTMNNHIIEYNGIRQSIYCYDEPRIRQEQIETINRFTVQAAGRARALRDPNAEVSIFSDFVIEDVDEIFT